MNLEIYMHTAIEEAKKSLQEGNHGFGAVIVKDDKIISQAHDLEETEQDSTSHAEINAIKKASKILGKKLEGCLLVSTHEPCPMCSGAIVWSGIQRIAYGYSINAAIKQGRDRINLSCEEIFSRSGKKIKIEKDISFDQCNILYHQDVRNEVKKLRNADIEKLNFYNSDSIERRVKWFNENVDSFTFLSNDLLESGYNLLLTRFNIDCSQAKIVDKSKDRIVFHSINFCPTLEACKILNIDTRFVCKHYNENSTDFLLKQVNDSLKFSRNYEKLRPYTDYCEEMISLDDKQ